MNNAETRTFEADQQALESLFNKARNEQRREDAYGISLRLTALTVHMRQREMSATQIIDLLEKEAARFENQSYELGAH